MRMTGMVSAIKGMPHWHTKCRHRYTSPEIGLTYDGRSPGSRVAA
jgi:hypothetical protein